MATDKNVNIKITAESKEAEKGINKVTAAVNKIGKSSTVKSISTLASAVTNSITAFDSLKSAVENAAAAIEECSAAYTKQRTAELALETAAKNSPYLNASNIAALKNYATQLSKLSGVADEDLLPTMTKLAQSGRTESEIMKIMSAATDVAASGVMGFEQACDELNKSLAGEMGSLKDINPLIAQMTAEELKAGKAVEAIARAFEGTNDSMGSLTGGAERLQNAITNIKEEIGSGFAEPINSFKTAIAEMLESVGETLKAARELDTLISEGKAIKALEEAGEELTLDQKFTAAGAEVAKLKNEIAGLEGSIEREKNSGNATNGFLLAGWQKDLDKYRIDLEAAEKKEQDLKDEIEERDRAAREAANNAKKEAEAAAEAAAEEDKNAKAAQALIEAYKKRVAAVKAEIEARRELGEEISGLDADTQVYETMFSGLVTLKVDGGSLMETQDVLADFYEGEKESLAQLFQKTLSELESMAQEKAASINALLAEGIAPDDSRIQEELKELEEINKRIEEMGGEPVRVSIEVESEEANEALERLKAAIDAATPSPDEWRRLSDTLLGFAEGLDEVRGTIPDAELAALEERIASVKAALTEPELEGWEKIADEAEDIYERIAELQIKAQEAATEGKLELEESYLEEVERLNELAAQKSAEAWDTYVSEMKQKFTSMVSQVTSAVGQITSIVSDTCSLMLDSVETSLDLTLTKLEVAYLSGEMGEEEYNDAVLKAKKEAAQAEYKIEMWEWAASILSATANIAEGVTKAIAQGGVAGIVTGALVSAAGAVQIATLVANKPTPPTFSTGGIVGGSSYTGDRVQALLNSGEMILNAGQQKNLFDSINSGNISKGDASGQSKQTFVQVNNSASNIVSAEPDVTEDKINMLIDLRVNRSLKKGRYNSALTQAEQGKTGKWYGS